jgi:transcriptional regulator with XRE-family HTH domain
MLEGPTQDPGSFATRLIEHRQELWFSCESLSAELGINQDTMLSLERGEIAPTFELLERMEDVGLDVLYLQFGTPMNSDPRVCNHRDWIRATQAISRTAMRHDLHPSPAAFWRMVRLLWREHRKELARRELSA